MDKKYYIGLDIGTNSCGWAVTDENYNLKKWHGQDLWGVRLYKEAETAIIRRQKRTNRRRLDRKKLQLAWLREIFQSEIEKLDPEFLLRLQYSSLYEEDKKYYKNLEGKDSLFHTNVNGQKYTDRDFFKEYPTIYHLREELIRQPAKDIRHLYLAIHNLIKRRGNFLTEGEFSINDNLEDALKEAFISCRKCNENIQLSLENIDWNNLQEIFQSTTFSPKEKLNNLYTLFSANKVEKDILKAFVDAKINVKLLFQLEENLVFNFNTENFEAELNDNGSMLDDIQKNTIMQLYTVYTMINLKKILGDDQFICQSMKKRFDKHKKELRDFKDFIRIYYPSQFSKIFRFKPSEKDVVNYALYINRSVFNGKKRIIGEETSKRTQEHFYKFIQKIIGQSPEINAYDEQVYAAQKQEFMKLMENNQFLLKQRTKDNSIMPNQLYENELKQILKINAEKYPFLNENVDGFGTNAEKIIQILKFKIPYFVGPIGGVWNAQEQTVENDANKHTVPWAVKNKTNTNNLPLRPWTLEKLIDFDKSEDKFIINMINKCSYLPIFDVLPKYSILYSKFRVLNELNNLKFDDYKISVPLKQEIFQKLFLVHNKVTMHKLKEFLKAEGKYNAEDIKRLKISGIDKNFANDMSSYVQLANIFGRDFVDCHIEMMEKIILYITIISDKERLARRLQREFGEKLNIQQIKALKGLAFSGWGRFSKEFLLSLGGFSPVNVETGEIITVMNELWDTNHELQTILHASKFNFQDEFNKLNIKTKNKLLYEDIEQLYCAPMVKRGAWQAVQIVQEIQDILGQVPDKIFVEVTRENKEKGDAGRKLSRKNTLQKIYESKDFRKAVASIEKDVTHLLEELTKKEVSAFRSDKLFLYFMQLGRCVYSGEKIDLDELYSSNNKYDIDHIIPQSKVKDDSLNNRVLAKKELNNKEKSDNYPLPIKWIQKQEYFWSILKEMGLMSQEKYERLTRKEPLSIQELDEFVARQLVSTNQSTKIVIDFLKNIVNNPRDVIYSKAKFVSDFRNEYAIYKSREINDLHHAKDAYLNIVVGNVIFNRFTKFYNAKNSKKIEQEENNYNKYLTNNPIKLFEKQVYANKNKDIVIWDNTRDLKKVQDICRNKHNCRISNFHYCNENQAFYDETIYKSLKNNDKNTNLTPKKGNKENPLSNTAKYGGFKKNSIAYFLVVKSEKKKKNQVENIYTIESVPSLLCQKYRYCSDKEEKIFEEIVQEKNLINAKILQKLHIQSTLKIDGGLFWLAGKTNDQFILHNANQWFMNNEDIVYSKSLEKYHQIKIAMSKGNNFMQQSLEEIDGKVILSPKRTDKNNEISLSKEQNIAFYQKILDQLSKKIYAYKSWKNFENKIKDNQAKFADLNVLEQADILYAIIQRLSTGSKLADLKKLTGEGNIGGLTLSRDITGKNVQLVQSSVTGLKRRIVKLS